MNQNCQILRSLGMWAFMGFFSLLLSPLPLRLPFLFLLLFPLPATAADDYTKLVFKGCANQKFQDPSGPYSENLQTLMSTLVSQSSQKPFSSTTSGSDQNAITGLYQCRGDLTTTQCYDCVSKIPGLISKRCGDDDIAARVQLTGCYLRYEVAGFRQVPMTDLLYRICGKTRGSQADAEFESRAETAFGMAQNGVKNSSALFYAGNYQSVYVLAQCEGNLGTSDCGDCVKSAFERSKTECSGSVSAQVYLQRCYISFTYYAEGVVPSIPSPSGDETSSRRHTQRTVAIAVGGVAALGFLIVCLLFVKAAMEKKHRKHDRY